ncbi:TIGR03621 family F420-dependent LLM class oxidoreductase [Actinomadura rupiterrae]|uniref:TIGR03621 family F420-dependent LLM class oxidoreductase n=1 Tax=Actinomadura rupiterrae TaxID=559627 RepID=UPI0020A5F4B6|nr:TIGR03621 family F420-dependent LLM class oxidoreductase [Actinomadura rupiterrae]MCP2341960.1 putative F420-dependent oxidoreductase [Actinomadura rupiterrae]
MGERKMRNFRFGFTVDSPGDQDELSRLCGTADSYGYDVALAVDHLGPDRSSPFSVLMATAFASRRLHVGTHVLNIGYWNPSILAREVATLVRLTEGRFELGIGFGIVKAQYDAARIPWHPFDKRMDLVAASIEEMNGLLSAEHGLEPPPLLVGGASPRALGIAAELADIASFGGRFQVPGEEPGTLRFITAEEADKGVEFLREKTGSRIDEMEVNSFILHVEVTDDRRAAGERIAAAREPHFLVEDAEHALDTPFMLIGTEEQIARQLLENRERYGFSYITVRRPHLETFGPVIKRVRELE